MTTVNVVVLAGTVAADPVTRRMPSAALPFLNAGARFAPMVQPRQPRYVEHGEWFVPDIRKVVADSSWTEDAACAGEADLYGADGVGPSRQLDPGSASELLKLLLCAGCPVRVACLRASLDPPALSPDTPGTAWGTWGGTDDWERRQTRDLPLEERAALLEATFPDRLRIRVEAWRASVQKRGASGKAVLSRDRRVAAILGEEIPKWKSKPRRSKLFTVGARGGPGRGHRSKIGRYAEIEGVSYSTAWRRLRASPVSLT